MLERPGGRQPDRRWQPGGIGEVAGTADEHRNQIIQIGPGAEGEFGEQRLSVMPP